MSTGKDWLGDGKQVILDNGSGVIKAGFSGEPAPKYRGQTIIGNEVIPGRPMYLFDAKIGDEVIARRGAFQSIRPIDRGCVVKNWEVMERIWEYVLLDQLKAKGFPVMVSEANLQPMTNRPKMMELLFEKFEAPAVSFEPEVLLSLYSTAKSTGLVVDSGDSSTQVIPVFEGYIIETAVQSSVICGRDVHENFMELMRSNSGGEIYFSTSAEKELAREIIEKVGFAVEEDMKTSTFRVPPPLEYEMPDGQVFKIGEERYLAVEALFYPPRKFSKTRRGSLESPGLPNLIDSAIQACEIDVRKQLYGDILLTGGTTLYPGLKPRIEADVWSILKGREVSLDVHCTLPSDRTNAPFAGGSVLATLSSYEEKWITKERYKEIGTSVLLRGPGGV